MEYPVSEQQIIQAMIDVGRRMYEKGFVAATSGNISARLDEERYLLTRSGVCKGDMTESDLVVCDAEGRSTTEHRVTSEVLLHLTAYRLRPDVNAVIHAHPPATVALSLAGVSLGKALLPEVVMTLGEVPTAPFAPPSSPESAEAIRGLIPNHDAIILDRHGSLTVGRDLWEACHNLERLEFAARATLFARILGEPKRLSSDELAAVQAAAERYLK